MHYTLELLQIRGFQVNDERVYHVKLVSCRDVTLFEQKHDKFVERTGKSRRILYVPKGTRKTEQFITDKTFGSSKLNGMVLQFESEYYYVVSNVRLNYKTITHIYIYTCNLSVRVPQDLVRRIMDDTLSILSILACLLLLFALFVQGSKLLSTIHYNF